MFASIVVGTDGSATAGEAVRRAAGLAEAHSADLHVVSAYRSSIAPLVAMGRDPATLTANEEDAAARAAVERMLDRLRGELAGGPVKVTTHALGYDAVTAILDVAAAQRADLIVVGNKGMPDRKLGSVPNELAHRANCDVLIVNTIAGG
jgi:nucleotide-binding universal stress UspA family protein